MVNDEEDIGEYVRLLFSTGVLTLSAFFLSMVDVSYPYLSRWALHSSCTFCRYASNRASIFRHGWNRWIVGIAISNRYEIWKRLYFFLVSWTYFPPYDFYCLTHLKPKYRDQRLSHRSSWSFGGSIFLYFSLSTRSVEKYYHFIPLHICGFPSFLHEYERCWLEKFHLIPIRMRYTCSQLSPGNDSCSRLLSYSLLQGISIRSS